MKTFKYNYKNDEILLDFPMSWWLVNLNEENVVNETKSTIGIGTLHHRVNNTAIGSGKNLNNKFKFLNFCV